MEFLFVPFVFKIEGDGNLTDLQLHWIYLLENKKVF